MLEVTQRAPIVSRSHSRLTDDEALHILFQENTSNPHGSWSPGRCHTPGSNRSTRSLGDNGNISGWTSNHKKKAAYGGHGSSVSLPPLTPSKEDEEALRTRKFWENWAAEATANLLCNIKEESSKELVFSGRIGPEPKFHNLQRSESKESMDTDISLFNCSDLYTKDLTHHVQKNKKHKAKLKVPEVNWELFARERKGMLDRFIQADASGIEGYLKNSSMPIQNVMQKTLATDIMTKQERRMLMQCAYSHGLTLANDNIKSCSTENLVTVAKPTKKLLAGSKSRAVTWKYNMGGSGDQSSSNFSDEIDLMGLTGRTDSPAAIIEVLCKQNRPESAVPALNPIYNMEVASRVSSASSRRSNCKILPTRTIRYEDSRRGSLAPTVITMVQRQKQSRRQSMMQTLPDLDGVFSSKVKRKICNTIAHLTKATGFGDKTDVSVPIEEEKDVYTDTDYARHPRYPQNIRIAPRLSKVIRDDIRDRMRRPCHHEVKVADVEALDNDHPALGRSHRNLLIFNWLNEVTEATYDDLDVPDIVDIEGEPIKRTYPMFKPGIVGQEENEEQECSLPTALSRNFNEDEISRSDISRSDFDSNDSFYD